MTPTPLIIAFGTLVIYLGLGFKDLHPAVLPATALLFALSFLPWLAEDVKYWRERRVDHGVLPGHPLGWWGMVFFLGTEVMLFGGLFATWFVAQGFDLPAMTVNGAPVAPATHLRELLGHALPLVTVNTLILITSGGTFHWALTRIKKNDRKGMVIGLIVTLVLGATFLGIQVREYLNLIADGVTFTSPDFMALGSAFYLLTGTHGFHVFLGLVLIGILIVRGIKGQYDAERHMSVEAFSIYWHFVDVVWIGLYLIVYVGVFG